jgi:hypothetical protein
MKSSIEQKAIKQIATKLDRAIFLVDEGARFVDLYDSLENDADRENCGLLVALAVHNSWFTITQIMKRVAVDLDHEVPRGKGAADRLIDLMAARTEKRPQIISPKLTGKARTIQSFQKKFRRASLDRKAPYEVIDWFETISDEILPDIMQNLDALMNQHGGKPAELQGPSIPIALSAPAERKVVGLRS